MRNGAVAGRGGAHFVVPRGGAGRERSVTGVSGPSHGVGGRSRGGIERRGGMGSSGAGGGRVGAVAVGGGVGDLMEP